MIIRVLLVEPDLATARQICQQLQQLGGQVVGQVISTKTALVDALKTHPDLVIINLGLEQSLATVQQLKLPVIYITPTVDNSVLQAAQKTQPCGYLLTPLNPAQLRISLDMALSHVRTRQQLQQVSTTYQAQQDQDQASMIATLVAQGAQRTDEMRNFVEVSPHLIFVINRAAMRIDYCNEVFAQTLYGLPRQEIEGRTVFECSPTTKAEDFIQRNEQVFEIGETLTVEAVMTLPDQTTSTFHLVKVPLRRPNGDIYALLGTARNITQIKATEAALRRSEERFRTSVENLLDGFAIFAAIRDFTGKIVDFRYEYINEAGCQLMQRSRAEIVGNTLCTLFPNQREMALFEEYVQVVETGQPLVKEAFDCKAVDSKQSWRRTFSLQATKLGNGFVVTWQDVTGQKQAQIAFIIEQQQTQKQLQASLEEKEVLLKEIHHRVKNNLQIIQSLLRLQSFQIEDPITRQMFRDSQNRIRSMALIHEHLYRSDDLSHINFAEYIQNLAHSLFRAYNSSNYINLTLDLAPVQINIDTALPCGLIINELVSNALKYAFQDGRIGTIEIGLQRHSQHAQPKFILTVADNGVGLPEPISLRTPESLGLQLVSDCTRQLEGQLQLERSGGTKFIISFSEI